MFIFMRVAMSLARETLPPANPFPRRGADAERRAQIVAAAERAFVRFGFHAATMQNVAEEAGMSAGNLYRYFPSKEALVEGLCAADQSERSKIFARLVAGGDLLAAISASLSEHLVRRPPEKARMVMEIWAEAGRNPRVAAFTRALDEDVLSGLGQLLDIAKASGSAAPAVDSRFAAGVIFTLVSGLFKRLALEPAFDPETEGAMAMGVLKALFAGAITPAEEI